LAPVHNLVQMKRTLSFGVFHLLRGGTDAIRRTSYRRFIGRLRAETAATEQRASAV